MKKISLIIFSIIICIPGMAQSWNPYLSQGIISPSPLPSTKSGGKGVISFNIGNTGSTGIHYDSAAPGNNVIIIIELSNGEPISSSPGNSQINLSIEGTWADMFSWKYDHQTGIIKGIQAKTILPESQGSIRFGYKAITDTPKSQPRNGFVAKLTVPEYLQVSNSVHDDKVSSFTWSEAGNPQLKQK
jgi:hypothetical protein